MESFAIIVNGLRNKETHYLLQGLGFASDISDIPSDAMFPVNLLHIDIRLLVCQSSVF